MSPDFTVRQQEIIGLVSDGLLAKEIAAKLFLSESCVKHHLGIIYKKMGFGGFGSRYKLIAWPHEGKLEELCKPT